MIHSKEEKLYVVGLLKSGYPLKRLCRERNLDRHQVRHWLLRYEKYGEDGICRSTRGYSFPPAKKARIVSEHIEQGVTLKDLSAKYDVGRNTISLWVRTVRAGGSLYDAKKRGRPRKA